MANLEKRIKEEKRYERKSWNDSQDEGITGLHYAYRLSDTYFPPSQFAIGWIAIHDESQLGKTLDALIQNQDKMKNDTPRLHAMIEAAKKYQQEHPRKALSKIVIDELSELARQKRNYGTDKIIRKNMVQEVNLSGDKATMSPYDQLSVRIDTRHKRSKKDKAVYTVSLYHAVVDEGKVPLFYAEGGTIHERKRKGQLNHWTSDDAVFMDDLRKSVALDFRKDDSDRITAEQVSEEFSKPTQIIGYAYATALIGFAREVRENRIRLKQGEEPLMPFDFDRHPEYAFEAFIMAHSFKRGKSQGRLEKRLFSADVYLSGKDIATRQFIGWYNQGHATKEIVKYSRSFEDYSWAIIQALEKHFYLKERPNKQRRYFAGYALEFQNLPYMTVSMVFRNRKEKQDSKAEDDFDVRIIYDSTLKLPYIMYKVPLMNAQKIITPGLAYHPLSEVNYAKGVSPGMHEEKSWNEKDDMTGRKVRVMVFEPHKRYLKQAEEISQARGRGAKDMKGRYIRNLQEFNKTRKL